VVVGAGSAAAGACSSSDVMACDIVKDMGACKQNSAPGSRMATKFTKSSNQSANCFCTIWAIIMYAQAPPQAWSYDGLLPRPSAASSAAPAAPDALASAWKHVRNVVSADSRPADLFDLLSHSVRETQYSFQPQGVRTSLWRSEAARWRCNFAIGGEAGVATARLLLGLYFDAVSPFANPLHAHLRSGHPWSGPCHPSLVKCQAWC
jgi:hypothetical protein